MNKNLVKFFIQQIDIIQQTNIVINFKNQLINSVVKWIVGYSSQIPRAELLEKRYIIFDLKLYISIKNKKKKLKKIIGYKNFCTRL
jgi:hypothetical protein